MRWLTKDREFYRTFFSMLAYIALQNLIVYGVNLADNVMIGAYSEDALSGVALVNQIQFLLQMIVNGVGEGLAVLGAQYWGQRKTGPIKKVVSAATFVGVCFGLLFMVVTIVAPRQVLLLLTNEEAVIQEGMVYLSVMSYSYVIFCLTTVLLAAMRSIQNVKIGTIISLSTLLINVALNYCLIFGRLGFPRLGTQGAAIATLVARIVELGIMAVYVLCVEKKLRMRIQDFFHFDKVLFRDFLRVGSPVILSGATWGIAMGVQTAILGRMGAAAIAANSIASAIFSVVSVLSYGGSSASGVITGMAVGRGDMGKLKEYVRTMQLLFLTIGVIAGVLLFACKDLILSFYTVAADTRQLADQFISVLSVTIMGTSYQVACLTGIVRAGGNTKFVLYNDLIFMWGLVLPLSALGAFVWELSPLVVFIFLKCDQILKCFVAVWQVNSYHWVRRLTREEPASDPQPVKA